MAAWRPELTTKGEVIRFYENSGITRFRIYAGTKPELNGLRYEYDGKEINEGVQILSEACDALLSNPLNVNTYVLQLVRSDNVIRTGEHKAAKKLQDAINITFQLNFPVSPYGGGEMQRMGAVNNNSNDKIAMLLEKMLEQQNLILSTIAAQKEVEEEEDEEDEMPLMGLLKNEKVQTLLIDKIVGLFDKGKPSAMAGIETTDLETVIKRLEKLTPTLVDDLAKLAEIGEKNKPLFDVLLNQLRAM